MTRKWLMIAMVSVLAISLTGCMATTRTGQRWGDIGLIGGAATGALLSPTDPWKGAVIGGAVGKIGGEVMGDAAETSSEQQLQDQPPPQGQWITVPGHYDKYGIWIEEHREWVPYQYQHQR